MIDPNELAIHLAISRTTLDELLSLGLVDETVPLPQAALSRLALCLRLHQDLELNWAGAALAVELLEELHALRLRVQQLETLLDRLGPELP
jgi:chaperone modulatory protein CbpM